MSRPPLRLSRRTALGGPLLAALVALAGCGTGATPGPDAAPAEDSDSALVESVLAELALAHHVVQANRRAHPRLATSLRPLERLHVVHARELSDAPLGGVTGKAADRTESLAAATTRVGRAEDRLERRLEAAARAAQSGALALLLASMSVGTAQQRAAA